MTSNKQLGHKFWATLSEGTLIDEIYQVVKPLISGSGGAVYLVEEVKQPGKTSKTVKKSRNGDKKKEGQKSNENLVSESEGQESQQSQQYVLKIYSTLEELELFKREFDALTILSKGHPNIVRAKDAQFLKLSESKELSKQGIRSILKRKHVHVAQGQEEQVQEKPNVAYIVFEYCSRSDLFAYVKSGKTRFQEKLCHALFYQIASGIQFMHNECKIAHLDIKLENMVVGENYGIKLIDFAFCEFTDSLLLNGKGTESYFAPEIHMVSQNQKSSNKQLIGPLDHKVPFTYVGDRADIFSLGILLFTMFFGQPPFKLNHPMEPLFNYISSGSTQNSEIFFENHPATRIPNKHGLIPPKLKTLLTKMLQMNPQSRPSIEDILLHDSWINNVNIMMNIQDYTQQMNSIYLHVIGIDESIMTDIDDEPETQ